MNILLNLILSFYPATLVWYSIPSSYITRIDSFSGTGTGDFISRAVVYIIIFVGCYMIINKFTSSGFFGRRRTGLNILAIAAAIVLALFVFYSILPGSEIYRTPSLVNQYILAGPYPFFAVLAPLLLLFFI